MEVRIDSVQRSTATTLSSNTLEAAANQHDSHIKSTASTVNAASHRSSSSNFPLPKPSVTAPNHVRQPEQTVALNSAETDGDIQSEELDDIIQQLSPKSKSAFQDFFADDDVMPVGNFGSKKKKATARKKTPKSTETNDSSLPRPKPFRARHIRLKLTEFMEKQNALKEEDRKRTEAALSPQRIAHEKQMQVLKDLNSTILGTMTSLNQDDSEHTPNSSATSSPTTQKDLKHKPLTRKARYENRDELKQLQEIQKGTQIDPLVPVDFYDRDKRQDIENGWYSMACVVKRGTDYYCLPFFIEVRNSFWFHS